MEGSDSSTGLPQFRKFVSETEVEEKRRKRQEEWERVRKPQDPIEAPAEDPEDNRSLYDRLQEQKNLKQAEYEEKFQLKNQVRGLDDEEAHFLEEVNRQQELVQREKDKEEEEVLAEYRISLASRVTAERSAGPAAQRTTAAASADAKQQKPSQSQLLSGAVKRKRPSDNSSEESPKEKDAKVEKHINGEDRSSVRSGYDLSPGASVAFVGGVLPGIGVYTDTEESDSSSDSDVDTDLFKRTKVVVQEQH